MRLRVRPSLFPAPEPPAETRPPQRGRRRKPRKPKARRTGWRRYVPSWKIVLAGFTSVVLLVTGLLWYGYATTPLPTEPQDGVTDQGSAVYYADGRTPILRLGANRELVAHDKIPDRLRWAVLAAEDRGFYSEPGISPMGMTRALWANATGGEIQGGSTVTQQLARNYYKGLNRDRTMGRKFKEFFVAIKLSRHKSKEEILDLYLNTVYFGRQTSGVQAAARAYFHKDVGDLDVAQCAMLAALIQQPGYFKTRGDDAAAKALRARWSYVIDGMVSMGKLDRAEASRLRFPATQRQWNEADNSGQGQLIRQRVLAELEQLKIPTADVLNGGLKIYTGLDKQWMEYAAEAVRGADEAHWPKSVRGGLIAVSPRDGAIKAFYGGDPKRSQYDTVFNPMAQAGSTFKPYVLAAALRAGYSVRSTVDGSSPVRFAPDGQYTPMTAPGYLVENDEKIGSLGKIDLIKATALSVNTGYVKLGFEAGLDNVRETARDFGVPAASLDPFKKQAGITLGVATIPAVNQAAGYAAFANGGTAVAPHVITKIVDPHGRSYPLPWNKKRHTVINKEAAAQATVAMRAVVNDGTGVNAALNDRQVAGKTGTTDHNRAAWFVGYVPQLSTAVMMVNTRNAPLKGIPGETENVEGGSVPAEIWRTFMEKATAGMPVETFPLPAFTGESADWSRTTPSAPPAGDPCTSSGRPECTRQTEKPDIKRSCDPAIPETCKPGLAGKKPDPAKTRKPG